MLTSGTQLADITAAGEIVVGGDPTYAPFESIDEGLPVGFSIDLAAELGDRMGVDVVYKSFVWESIIPSLVNKEFDILLSSMTITDERDETIDFSEPYYNSSFGILVKDGNPLSIVDETDLEGGVKIGVQTGTTSDTWATENAGIADTDITRLANFDALYLLINNNEIDVILGDAPVIGYAASTGSVTGEVVATFGDVEAFGVGMREDEPELQAAINGYLATMKTDGTLDDLTECWFANRPFGTTNASPDCTAGTVKYDDGSSDDGFLPLPAWTFLLGIIVIPIMKKYKK